MNTNAKIKLIQEKMAIQGIDMYYIPTSDYHHSEYVHDYFKSRAFISGFTGSTGDLLITLDKAYLWSDGRYYIQAEKEISGSCITFMKSGSEGVLSISEWIIKHIQSNNTIAFDGKVVPYAFYELLNVNNGGKVIKIASDVDFVAELWVDRRPLPFALAYEFKMEYAGINTATKIANIRSKMLANNEDMHIVASLDDVAWILNIRGNDVPCFPVVYAFLVIALDETYVFIDLAKVDDKLQAYFDQNNIKVMPYSDIYTIGSKFNKRNIVFDPKSVATTIAQGFINSGKIVLKDNYSQLMRAIKNPVEIENTKKAHIKDGVALCKFMHWFKQNIGIKSFTEIDVEHKLLEIRSKQEGFLEVSFDTIAAYKQHGAMMHYSASKKSNAQIQNEGLLLVDSGGQYIEGTTDITRTFVCGNISAKEKEHFTLALQGMINLSKAKFIHGARGFNLDVLARLPMWEHNLDYLCGTGHGVGHVLNVHEGPVGFRWKINPSIEDTCVLEAGMITSNEPGIYIAGSHGIRHENELLICAKEANEYGQFMYFETLTFVPFDFDGIDVSILTFKEKDWLNNYHDLVYKNISPYLNTAEKDFLKKVTQPI